MPNLEGLQVLDTIPATPDISKLTTGNISGTGVFDTLLRAVKAHLLEEFNANRITGKEYTTVYLGAIQTTITQSIQYLLNQEQAAEIAANIGLIRQKTVTELAQTDDTFPSNLGFNATQVLQGLLADQKILNAKQIDLADAQIDKATSEKTLVNQKIITELAQTDDTIGTAAQPYALNDSNVIAGLIKAQTVKTTTDAELIQQKVITELANTVDTLPTAAIAKTDNTTTTIGGLVAKQSDKTVAETQLLDQKTVTELAQTADTIPIGTGVNSNTDVTGMIGKQKSLFAAQTDGFARDAEQKLLKIMTDTLTAQIAGDANTLIPTQLQNPSVDEVLTKAKAGIGV